MLRATIGFFVFVSDPQLSVLDILHLSTPHFDAFFIISWPREHQGLSRSATLCLSESWDHNGSNMNRCKVFSSFIREWGVHVDIEKACVKLPGADVCREGRGSNGGNGSGERGYMRNKSNI